MTGKRAFAKVAEFGEERFIQNRHGGHTFPVSPTPMVLIPTAWLDQIAVMAEYQSRNSIFLSLTSHPTKGVWRLHQIL